MAAPASRVAGSPHPTLSRREHSRPIFRRLWAGFLRSPIPKCGWEGRWWRWELNNIEKFALLGPVGWEVATHDQVLEHQVFGLPAIENGFGDVRGEECKFEKASVPKLVAMSIGTYRSIDRNVEHV